MKRFILTLLALALAATTASPAFATIYTYSLKPAGGTNWKGAGTFTIDTKSATGKITMPGNIIIEFSSADLLNFRGNFKNFTAQIDPQTLTFTTYNKRGKARLNRAAAGQTFTLALDKTGQMTFTASSYKVSTGYGWTTKPGWTRTAKAYTSVPAPDSFLLLGLGLIGLFSLRRFGARSTPAGPPRLGGLVPA